MSIFPKDIKSGLTFEATATLPSYPATDWNMSAFLRGPSTVDLVATKEGGSFLFSATPVDTAAWQPGAYWYTIRVENGTDTHEVECGQLEILPDLAAQNANYDGRIHQEKVLAAIEAVIEGRASKDQESYKINDRELRRTPLAELTKLRTQYRNELAQVRAAAKGKQSLGRIWKARFPA